MKTWIVSSLDEETIQGEETTYSREETIWGNTVNGNWALNFDSSKITLDFKGHFLEHLEG